MSKKTTIKETEVLALCSAEPVVQCELILYKLSHSNNNLVGDKSASDGEYE